MVKSDKDEQSESKFIFSIDEELGDSYEDAPLTWRGSPSSTFADCTLVLTNTEQDDEKATYHVHRAVLGASDRRCLYFMKASQKNVANINVKLDYKAAQDVFPVLLDFVYFGELNIHTENAEALRYIADLFQCRPLRQAVNKFIESDFSVATSIHYVSETERFNDKPLLNVAVRESAKLFGSIDIDAFSALKPELFAAIVTDKHFSCREPDRLSKSIIHYFQSNPEHLTPSRLVQLTRVVPTIRPQEARLFLELVEKLDPPLEGDSSWLELTPLCIHCSNAIAPMVWRDDEIKSQDDFFFNGKWAGDGSSRLFITRLVASLEYAKEQCQIQKLAIEDIQENAAHSQNEVMELTKKLAERKVRKVITVQTEGGDDARDDPGSASPRYSDVCRDLAMNLSHKLNEKEQIIQELEGKLQQKESELERVSQMMVHLNARLKFYEILHNDGQSPARHSTPSSKKSAGPTSSSSPPPKSPSSTLSPPSPSSTLSPPRKSSQSSSFTVPSSPGSTTSTQRVTMKNSRQPSRPDTESLKSPTTPRSHYRPTEE
ncbi:BTB/POZ domain containing protein [Fragilaria crotonensis]|nr:BTB/POZ domain containing protein [Fragilaria crotonensis]